MMSADSERGTQNARFGWREWGMRKKCYVRLLYKNLEEHDMSDSLHDQDMASQSEWVREWVSEGVSLYFCQDLPWSDEHVLQQEAQQLTVRGLMLVLPATHADPVTPVPVVAWRRRDKVVIDEHVCVYRSSSCRPCRLSHHKQAVKV